MMRFAVLLALVASSHAFVPSTRRSVSSTTELGVSRRDAFGLAFTGFVAGVVPEVVNAANPALETFKGRKTTKGAFIPGKGMRDHESFENLVAVNPALETFKGGKKTKGTFIPGKGLRDHESFETLMA